MATISDPRNAVNYAEPQVKPPPVLAAGPLAWIRDNLFKSWLDAALTIVSGLVIITVVTSLIQWAVGSANWFIINFNLRQYMVGRYEPQFEWRLQLMVLLIAFVVGFNLATWARISRSIVIGLVAAAALTFVLPPVIQALTVPANAYLVAGNVDVTSGASTETPLAQMAFIAREGDEITVRIAQNLAIDDQALSGMYAFTDNASNLLRNAAANRLSIERRIAELQALLAGDTLTPRQREATQAELDGLEAPPSVTETYAVNQQPVMISILDGASLEPLVSAPLGPDTDLLRFTAPASGWYVLEKQIEGETSAVALLQTEGIYPLLVRDVSVAVGETDAVSGEVGGRSIQYVRMTDNFISSAQRPVAEGENIPINVIVDNQYRGVRSFNDYLRLFLGPFLGQISIGFALILVLAIAGYAASKFADRIFVTPDQPRQATRRAAVWMLGLTPIVMFILVYGLGGPLPLTDTRRWGGLLLTILLAATGIILSFPIGVLLALGRRSKLPVISTFCTLYIEFVRGVPLITVLFMSQLLVPLLNPTLAEIPNVFRAMVGIIFFSAAYLAENVRGGLQSIPPGQEEAARALGLNGLQVTMFITLPQALRAVIPALVGQFISLFKDTSLVAIVGLLDLTGMSEVAVAQTEFIGLRRESFIFIVVIYFSFSYTMSYLSRRLEATGSGAARRV